MSEYPQEIQEEYLNKFYQGFENPEGILTTHTITSILPFITSLAISAYINQLMVQQLRKTFK